MHHATLSAVHRTPVELWAQVLDALPFQDLVSATQVCRRWNDVVSDLPGFWRTVRLDSLTTRSLYWASRQIDAARYRTFALTIDIKTPLGLSEEGALMRNVSGLRFGLRLLGFNASISIFFDPSTV
ncbi:hypothetical protein AURDEDRAFT_176588 [Auricularia subglabra TFB-10046 SS5]|nr:hypothetical protein AURDEDRAFT_176588 [Auricularia subglabra TFB-10046 SS5]